MSRKIILNLALPLLLSLALPSWGKDGAVTSVLYVGVGAAETEMTRKGSDIALPPTISMTDPVNTQRDSQSVNCSHEQNTDHPDCAGGPREQAQDGTPGPFSQAD